MARAKADSPLLVGSTEQYILTQALRDGTPGESGVRAVAAMFGRSPLALAALPGRELTGLTQAAAEELRVGVHEDTVGLVSRLLPSAVVVPVGRDDKMELLRSGQIDAAQARRVFSRDGAGRAYLAPISRMRLAGVRRDRDAEDGGGPGGRARPPPTRGPRRRAARLRASPLCCARTAA